MIPVRRLAPLVAASVLAVGALAGCGSSQEQGDGDRGGQGAASVEGGTGGSIADRAFATIPGEPFTAPAGSVSNDDGSTFTYAKAPEGKITLVYFGYTNCPDVCPTTMADIAAALTKLPASVRDKVDVQFVSTDPARDTGPQIKSWLAGFDPSFNGGRAPIQQVIAQARAYGIGVSAPKVTKGDYQVSHGASVLALKPGGEEIGYFRELSGPEGYQAVLPRLVQKWA